MNLLGYFEALLSEAILDITILVDFTIYKYSNLYHKYGHIFRCQ